MPWALSITKAYSPGECRTSFIPYGGWGGIYPIPHPLPSLPHLRGKAELRNICQSWKKAEEKKTNRKLISTGDHGKNYVKAAFHKPGKLKERGMEIFIKYCNNKNHQPRSFTESCYQEMKSSLWKGIFLHLPSDSSEIISGSCRNIVSFFSVSLANFSPL